MRERPEDILLRREQQFRDHVPVNASKSFIGEKRAGTPGKRLMIEMRLEHVENVRRFLFDQLRILRLFFERG